MTTNPSPKHTKKVPQQLLSDFWSSFHTKYPGKVTSIFPRALYTSLLPTSELKGASSTCNAEESYEAAARECREKIKRIVLECERTNQKFTDPDFDIEHDPSNNCLNGLVRDDDSSASEDEPGEGTYNRHPDVEQNMNRFIHGRGELDEQVQSRSKHRHFDSSLRSTRKRGVRGSEAYSPGSVHRVDWIFEDPQFTKDGYSSSDIKQGANGNCWWLAAVATIAHRKDLMQKVCVARDEECGAYGFVFQRDGQWISTVVDDSLYLTYPDFDWYGDAYDSTGKKGRQHRERYQTGSEALYFAHCEDKNETWLPLLEKAYAKIHGDYEAISGGWPGEAVEDMTGGVTSTIVTNRVLRKDRLWKELSNSDGDFVFALAAMDMGAGLGQKTGLALGHAYSILQSRQEVGEDGQKVRLVQIRNPWGQSAAGVGEWMGPWSDGSKEWTPYWMKRLDHTFGDDGVFWMSFDDMLANFKFLHRTRIFDEKWTVVQQWTSANISWVTGYLRTKFVVEVKKAGMIVFVLTQLDDRYFHGLEGQYWFQLHFILRKQVEGNEQTSERICHVMPVHDYETRSVSCEVDLEPGIYEVLPKVTATRHRSDSTIKPVEEVVKEYADKNPQKLRQVGAQYDGAHAKGGILDEDTALELKRADRKKAKRAKKALEKKAQQEALVTAAKVLEETAKVMSEMATDNSNEGDKIEPTREEEVPEGSSSNIPVGKGNVNAENPKENEVNTGASRPKSLLDSEPTPATEEGASGSLEDSNQTIGAGQEEQPGKEYIKDEITEEADCGSAESSDDESVAEEPTTTSWNAVCVFGLRVYAQDSEISIDVAK